MKIIHGFTLIELLFVIAIIAILSSIALPAYQHYLEKAQIAEAFALGSGAELAVVDSYHEIGSAPINREQAGLSNDASNSCGRYVSKIEIDHGAIRVTFGDKAHAKLQNKTLQFTPYVSKDDNIVLRAR